MLFGNFIELLDDLVPGMWAEMLNDRGFEGVVPPANWVYYDGSPTFCDRRWDKGPDWALETNGAFNGPRCADHRARSSPGRTDPIRTRRHRREDLSLHRLSAGKRLRPRASRAQVAPSRRPL